VREGGKWKERVGNREEEEGEGREGCKGVGRMGRRSEGCGRERERAGGGERVGTGDVDICPGAPEFLVTQLRIPPPQRRQFLEVC